MGDAGPDWGMGGFDESNYYYTKLQVAWSHVAGSATHKIDKLPAHGSLPSTCRSTSDEQRLAQY